MSDNNTNVLPPAQQAPDDIMDVHQPPPTKRHAVNKYLIHSHTSNQLSQNIDLLLKEHGYKRSSAPQLLFMALRRIRGPRLVRADAPSWRRIETSHYRGTVAPC
jgi:hypothetical protein